MIGTEPGTRPWVKFSALQKKEKKMEQTINSVSKSRDQTIEKAFQPWTWSSFSRRKGR